MSEDATPEVTKDTETPLQSPKSTEPSPKRILLVSYPKVVYFYPTLIASVIAGIYMAVAGNEARPDTHIVSLGFLVVLGVNLVVLSFDFPRATSLTLFFFFAALGLGLCLSGGIGCCS